MKVAIVHYWLVGMRGGEKVIEALCELYPEAHIFTHAFRPERIAETIRQHPIHETFIGKLPFSKIGYKAYLPLMPLALEQLDLHDYDLVISSEAGPAKGVITHPDALHVCYCHTPMRYVWSGYHSYRSTANGVVRFLMPAMMHRLRMWDVTSAARVDHFIANSINVAERIRKYYRRDATVIYPPVDIHRFDSNAAGEDFYLFVSELVSYKRADIAIDAFNRLGRRLVVIGRGVEFSRLKKRCGPTIEMLGWQDGESLHDHYRRCRALVFVADEDFGMVPVEAMSAGRPVIAFDRGGVRETIVPGRTGILFREQNADSMAAAVELFEAREKQFDPRMIAAHAARFSKQEFKRQVQATLNAWLDEHRLRRASASAAAIRPPLPPPAPRRVAPISDAAATYTRAR